MNNPLIARLLALTRSWGSSWRIALARATGARIGDRCVLGPGCDLQLGIAAERQGALTVGPGCVLQHGVVLHPYGGSVTLGDSVFLGPGVVIYGHGGVTIGDHTLVAMHCRIVSANHAIPPPGTLIRNQSDLPQTTRIGRDVWLGAGVTVLAGVTIGEGCIVSAGAVVTRDLPPNTIAMGVPAIIKGRRDNGNTGE